MASRHNMGEEQQLSALEQEVLDEYATLAGNLEKVRHPLSPMQDSSSRWMSIYG